MEEAIDPANPGNWVLIEDNGWSRIWEADLGDRVVRKTEFKNADGMLDKIAEQRNNSLGQRWGDGQVVGRIPMNLYYASGFAEASRQRDHKWMRQFYRDHSKLKTFDGDL